MGRHGSQASTGGLVESCGKAAERLVAERIRAALPADAFHLYPM